MPGPATSLAASSAGELTARSTERLESVEGTVTAWVESIVVNMKAVGTTARGTVRGEHERWRRGYSAGEGARRRSSVGRSGAAAVRKAGAMNEDMARGMRNGGVFGPWVTAQ